jgi:hypothetical protein
MLSDLLDRYLVCLARTTISNAIPLPRGGISISSSGFFPSDALRLGPEATAHPQRR